MSRPREMGRGATEVHFSVVCWGLKSMVGGEGAVLEITSNHNIDGGGIWLHHEC